MAMTRSENMRRIRSRNTKPELEVRKVLRRLGYVGYRLHRKELPGKPDVVFVGRQKAIFVHGCFWHGHDCKEGLRRPKTNQEYWELKISRNQERDTQHIASLRGLGWQVLTLWDCDLASPDLVETKVRDFMERRV